MRHGAIALALAGLLLLPGLAAMADPVFQQGGKAIRGYDPVAYFTDGGPVRGKREHRLEWNGAEWRFATAANRAAFEAEPERYAPQYGGYCAWAVSQGYTASIDPAAWRIVDDKLYLNYSAGVQKSWEKDIPTHIAAANGHWPGLLEELSK